MAKVLVTDHEMLHLLCAAVHLRGVYWSYSSTIYTLTRLKHAGRVPSLCFWVVKAAESKSKKRLEVTGRSRMDTILWCPSAGDVKMSLLQGRGVTLRGRPGAEDGLDLNRNWMKQEMRGEEHSLVRYEMWLCFPEIWLPTVTGK
jgi:hypothetical protein